MKTRKLFTFFTAILCVVIFLGSCDKNDSSTSVTTSDFEGWWIGVSEKSVSTSTNEYYGENEENEYDISDQYINIIRIDDKTIELNWYVYDSYRKKVELDWSYEFSPLIGNSFTIKSTAEGDSDDSLISDTEEACVTLSGSNSLIVDCYDEFVYDDGVYTVKSRYTFTRSAEKPF